MSLLKTCAAVLSLILVLQTGCDLWCHRAESEGGSSQHTAVTPVPACHGTTEKSEGSEQKPAGNHEPSKDCVHPQAADDNSKLHTKIAKASHPVVFVDFPVVQVGIQLHALTFSAPDTGPFKVAPPSSLILRI